jgi:uncharacterized RDD family membrane protein YckC
MVNMPETPYRHDQPADDIPAGHEHARLTAADQPNYPSASDRDQAPQSPPTVQASAATQADAAPPPLDPRRSAGATPQDAQDAAGQREAATPTPEGPPAATEEPATLRLRALAFAVDLAVVTLALLVPILIGALTGVDSLWMLGVVLAAGGIIYHTVWVWLSGQTPGKALFDLAVRHGDTAPARTWQGLLWCLGRHYAGYLIADLGGVGVLFALTQSRRCLHDYAFDSRVIIRSTGARGSWSLLARLDDYDKRLDASIEERGKWYAPLVSLWKSKPSSYGDWRWCSSSCWAGVLIPRSAGSGLEYSGGSAGG